ncbi:hypothetical protein FCV25MIE_06532 [Fagus crenata]
MSSEASSTNNQSPPSPPPPEQNYLTHEFPCGTITILVKMEWAALISMEYDDQRSLKFVREGELVVKVIMPSTNPIFLTTCKVGNHRWPIAKDAPIIRFSPRTFAFGIPGLLYGLRLAPDCDEDKLDNLIKFFMDYGDYEDFSENTTGIPWPDPEKDTAFWPKSLPRIEPIIHSKLAAFGHIPGRSLSAVGDEVPCLLRAIRLSSVTDLITNAMLSGILRTSHIQIHHNRLRMRAILIFHKIQGRRAFPTVSVFTKLVEAVETILVIAAGNSRLLKDQYSVLAAPLKYKVWRLSKEGIGFLLKLSWEIEQPEEENRDENVQNDGPVESNNENVQNDASVESNNENVNTGSDGDASMESDNGNVNTSPGGSGILCPYEIEHLIKMAESW